MKKKKSLLIELSQKYIACNVTPPCIHFGQCGGCLFQNIKYEDQLLLKKEYLSSVMEDFSADLTPSSPLHYRNRMDFVTAFGKTGLRKSGSHRHVVDILSCSIMQHGSNELLKTLLPHLHDVEDYNYLTHQGYLRYIVIREGRYTGNTMLNFVVAQRENRLEGVIQKVIQDATSISLILNSSRADLSFGEVFSDIKSGTIEESLDGIRFRITPNSFFQSNSEMALAMYRKIRSEAKGNVLDLYSGVGSISLFVAGAVEQVTGVELLPDAVSVARENMDLNNIRNSEFICADALAYVREQNKAFTTVILDPPRSGMNPRMIKHMREMSPEKIIYMSCNPVSFKDDFLALENYNIESFEAFDMFPQTPHIETLAVLKRRP